MKPYAICILILSPDKKSAVGVARRTNANSWGLAGGKIDDEETPEEAAIRECREETGIILSNPKQVWQRDYDKGLVITFTGETSGEPTTQEGEPECRWCSLDELMVGVFGLYNKDLFAALGL